MINHTTANEINWAAEDFFFESLDNREGWRVIDPRNQTFAQHEGSPADMFVEVGDQQILLQDFVSGVFFSLAARGRIKPEAATPLVTRDVSDKLKTKIRAHRQTDDPWDTALQYGGYKEANRG